jgi:hypothetical protein
MSHYDHAFYQTYEDGSASSAEVIVPLVLSLFPVSSVVDIGCGIGAWLQAFERKGIADYLGLDGDYVPRDLLRIPPDRFRAVDLARLSRLSRRFDLACSLEVAEHLPPRHAEQFVSLLTETAPIILFSAAIPHQGGRDHLNEQWQSYWCTLFKQHDFVAVDCIRPAIYGNLRVDWWYRQNVLIYCKDDFRPTQHESASDPFDLNRVDPSMIEALAPPSSIKSALRAVGRDLAALCAATKRRLHRTLE